MVKRFSLLIVCLTILLTACSKDDIQSSMYETNIKLSDDNSEEQVKEQSDSTINFDVNNAEAEELPMIQKELNMEEIRILSDQEELTLEDFSVYTNKITDDSFANTSNEYFENFTYEIEYEEQLYYLYVSYYIPQDVIRSAFLYNQNVEPMQRAEIRTGLIDEVINADIDMHDYASYSLPKNVTEGEFSIYQGYYGGQEFICDGQVVGGFYFTYAQDLRPRISGDELIEIGWLSKAISYVEMETIKEPSVPCMLCLQDNADTGMQSWCAYFCMLNAQIGFALELDSKIFSKEDMMGILKSISFIPTAFVCSGLNP